MCVQLRNQQTCTFKDNKQIKVGPTFDLLVVVVSS